MVRVKNCIAEYWITFRAAPWKHLWAKSGNDSLLTESHIAYFIRVFTRSKVTIVAKILLRNATCTPTSWGSRIKTYLTASHEKEEIKVLRSISITPNLGLGTNPVSSSSFPPS